VIQKDRDGYLRQHGIPDEMKPRVTIFGDLTLDAGEGMSLTLDPPLRASIDGDQNHIQDVADAIV